MINFSIQELVNKTVREGRGERKEIHSWHPSKLGSCLTGVYLERTGAEPDEPIDDRTLRVFSVGTMMENWLVGALEKQYAGIKRQVRVESAELGVSGYADLVVSLPDGKERVYEVKSKHSKSFWYMEKKGEGANVHHKMQLWLYLKLLNVESGNLVYVSKDDLAILEYPIFRDDAELEGLVMEELKILNEAWAKQIPPPPITDPTNWKSRYCAYHKSCLKYAKGN